MYISGYESVSATNNTYIAKYWKNGAEVSLSNGTMDEFTTDIFVDTNGDIYVSGFSYNSTTNKRTPKYWKNGVETILQTDNQGVAHSIKKYGEDIYVVGNSSVLGSSIRKACYWKNGVKKDLTTIDDESSARDIVMNQNNLYILGNFFTNSPRYWKNDQEILLPRTNNCFVNSIVVK